MALKIIQDLYSKKGEEFISLLFKNKVCIKEKLDATTLIVNIKDDIKFYNKNRHHIDKIQRTIMKYYEYPIEYLETQINKVRNQIDENITSLVFEYFPTLKPNNILYELLPKNKLVLTGGYINDELITYQNNESLINKLSSILNVGKEEYIFSGKLNDEQISSILEFIKTPKEDIKLKYVGTSFVSFIIKQLNLNLSKTSSLHNNLDVDIDSLIFEFTIENSIDNKKQIYYAKLIDPIFDDMHKIKKQDDYSDIIAIVQSYMIEFMHNSENEYKKIELNQNTFDEKYIELMCQMFDLFYEDYQNKFKNINHLLPNYLKREEFSINIKFIKYQEIKEKIIASADYRELLKIFLNLFKKKEKNEKKFITKATFNNHINIVKNIHEYLGDTLEESVNESLNTEYDLILEKKSKIDNNKITQFISFWQGFVENESETNKKIKKDKLEEVNIVIGKFQPFHNGHLQECNDIFEKNDKKVVLIQKLKKGVTENSPYFDELMEESFNYLIENNKFLKEFYIYKNDGICDFLNELNYNIKTITCNQYLKEEIEKHSKKYNLKLTEDFEFKSFSHHENGNINSKYILKLLKEDDFIEFKKVVPKELHNLYQKLKNKINI